MTGTDYRDRIERWHAQRMERLVADESWLTLAGLEWITPGAHTIGTDPANDVIIGTGPAHLGTVTLDDAGTIAFAAAPDAEAEIDGKVQSRATLDPNAPTWVRVGALSFFALKRGERLGLRFYDRDAATRTSFPGIERFPVDPAWRVTADWVELSPPIEMMIDSVIGIASPVQVTHRADFTLAGAGLSLLATHGTPAAPMFVFRDATSGHETYAAARFLTGEPVGDGQIVLDFNTAINPPCAFTPYATCPLPPPGNHLPVAVVAGERYGPVSPV